MKGAVVSAEEAIAHSAHVSGVALAAVAQAPGIASRLQAAGIDVIEFEVFDDCIAAGAACLAEKRFLAAAQCSGSLGFASAMRLPLVSFSFGAAPGPWPMLAASSVQELADTIVQSFAVAESAALPVAVGFDAPVSVRDVAQMPTQQSVRPYAGKIKLIRKIDVKKPSVIGEQDIAKQNAAMAAVPAAAKKADERWKKKFRRGYGLFEAEGVEDAKTVLVAYGFHAPTVKVAAASLRDKGEPVGFLRLRLLNPLPGEAKALLAGRDVVAFDSVLLMAKGFAAMQLGAGARSVVFSSRLNESDVTAAARSRQDEIIINNMAR